MRFLSKQDYSLMVKLNKELITTIIDTPVIIWKLVMEQSQTNIYGEGVKKTNYTGVAVPCLIHRQATNPTDKGTGVLDIVQRVTFTFLRQELNDRNIYPEAGDIVEFDTQYYELENTNEIQLVAGQPEFDHNIFCDAHLMRIVPTQLKQPRI